MTAPLSRNRERGFYGFFTFNRPLSLVQTLDMRYSIILILACIFYLNMPQTIQAQNIWQLFSAQSFHSMPNGPEKIKAIRKLEKDGWFAIDTFLNLDQKMEFKKTDLAPYIDDNGNTIFLVTDVSPAFPNGDTLLRKMLQGSLGDILSGPDDEVQNSIYIKFSVETDGSIAEVEEAQQHSEWIKPEIIKSCLETVRAMPKWSPGIWKGKPVKVKMLISVNLRE